MFINFNEGELLAYPCPAQVLPPTQTGPDLREHEAISLIEDDSLDTNTIIDVVQKGYTIMERTLRPAKVVVSKKSQEKS